MNLIRFIKLTFQDFGKDKVGQLSAAFAYSAVFSLGPLLLVLVSIVGFIYGARAAQGELYGQLAGALGSSTAHTLQNVVAHTQHAKSGIIALITGVIGMLLGATGITSQLQSSFDQILDVVPDPKGGIKRTVYVKLKNVLLVIFASLLIAASLVLSAVVTGLGHKLRQYIGFPVIGLELLNNAVTLLVFVGLLYGLYRVVPDVRIPRKICLTAGAVVALLFLIGKIVLALIIGRNGTVSAYGAAASLVSLLLWIYYSGQIIFIGAEGIKAYGFNHSLSYAPKRLNLKRTTVRVDADNFSGRLIHSWIRGFRKGMMK